MEFIHAKIHVPSAKCPPSVQVLSYRSCERAHHFANEHITFLEMMQFFLEMVASNLSRQNAPVSQGYGVFCTVALKAVIMIHMYDIRSPECSGVEEPGALSNEQ